MKPINTELLKLQTHTDTHTYIQTHRYRQTSHSYYTAVTSLIYRLQLDKADTDIAKAAMDKL